MEADTAGSDLSFRLRPAATDGVLGGRLAPDPSIAVLATAARLGLTDGRSAARTRRTPRWGCRWCPGCCPRNGSGPLRSLWPQVAPALAAWPGTAIVDLGRLHPGQPGAAGGAGVDGGAAADPGRPWRGCTTCGTGSRELVRHAWATPAGTGPNLGVVVTGELRDRRSSVEQVRQVLASIGSPAPVIGFVAHDPAGARGLWAGELTRRFAGSELVRLGPGDRGGGAGRVARTAPVAAPTVAADDIDAEPDAGGDPAHGAAAESAGPVMEGTRS